MDLKKASDDERLQLCKKYFYIGFLLLPFLWLINFFWFFRIAFCAQPVSAQQKDLRKYVIYSGIGSGIWLVLIIGWNIYFQINRPNLSWGDSMSFIIPIGRA